MTLAVSRGQCLLPQPSFKTLAVRVDSKSSKHYFCITCAFSFTLIMLYVISGPLLTPFFPLCPLYDIRLSVKYTAFLSSSSLPTSLLVPPALCLPSYLFVSPSLSVPPYRSVGLSVYISFLHTSLCVCRPASISSSLPLSVSLSRSLPP